MRPRRLPALLLLPWLTAAPGRAQAPFLERVDVEVVNVDVHVTDGAGQPVQGLAKGEFELREDGRPVALTNFVAVTGAPAQAAPAPPSTSSPARPRRTTSTPSAGAPTAPSRRSRRSSPATCGWCSRSRATPRPPGRRCCARSGD